MSSIKQLDKSLDKAIKSRGVPAVIAWLSMFENTNISSEDIIFFKKLKKETLRNLNIRLIKSNEEKSTDAKMIISQICETHTNLKIKELADFLQVSEQSIFYYKNVCKNRLQFPTTFADFNKNYKEIIKNIEL